MRAWAVPAVALAVAAAAAAAGAGIASRTAGCAPAKASAAYARSVRTALLAGRDLWGDRLLAAPGGPTYRAARRYLAPLLYDVEPDGRPVTASGVYYLALAMPPGPEAERGFALHVADGSEIVTRHVGGPSLSIYVGRSGRERYGACVARRGRAQLADGYLPILETSYVDAGGVGYRQESFAAHVPDTRSLVSFVHLQADARRATSGAVIRLLPSLPGRLVSRRVGFAVRRGEVADVYAAWIDGPSRPAGFEADARSYGSARRAVVRFWQEQLARAVTIDVPEPRVDDAERALLVQELSMTWRYSVGNTYEELSFAESLDAAEVMAEYGYGDVARAILRFALSRLAERFSSFRAGLRLAAGALYYRLDRDRAYLREETPALAAAVARLGREIERPGGTGLLGREPVSTDVGTRIYGLHAETAVWAGLLAMSRIWKQAGDRGLSRRSNAVATRLAAALHRAVLRSERMLPDGSLLVPLALLDPARPFGPVTASKDGTYWNLLAPYALASGFFRPHGPQARALLRFLLGHGSRLLGLVRSTDYKLYGRPRYPVSGTDQVYGLSVSRFLADNDQPDQLVLSLYGMLAGSMTAGTYVSGEGATVAPLHGQLDRTMLLPPNSGANAAFLETLRLLLVHESSGPTGAPTGLELAFATPRAWLADGESIRVRRAPTSFGPVSYTLERRRLRVKAALVLPAAPSVRLRLRLPAGTRITAVRAGGRLLPFDTVTGTIDLSGRRGPVELDAVLSRGRGS